ncbi:N-formylglutamate amidohydrolase [Candidatus Nitrotoga fabula]|uniref:N-formylglutamate amidohydrolase n=1 Tax=Candidatus Nitrotoga fabula TaxID=2182327 RepID=A0A916FB05_9PROT|nr:N-formylglutamate amidohydrolase [Candidatus Nitrotoga fabula]CAE6689171.1 N-formylglutamate amidohydrolase [Candidatus Nitrotoga fabula]
MDRKDRFLITCEHGGNRIPQRYRHYFLGHEALLQTHRGYDPGALTMARELAQALAAPFFYSTVSRLLIDLNRSIGHPRLYSDVMRKASRPDRNQILEQYYLPYRRKVEAAVEEAAGQGRRVIHIASHSFTPQLDGEIRNADIGLLYDPQRPEEKAICLRWQEALTAGSQNFRVRRNYPYIGNSDCLCSYLRRRFTPGEYVGIELEINQRHALAGGHSWRALRETVLGALLQVR